MALALSACATPAGVGDGGGGPSSPDHDYEAVAQWAAEVADAWTSAPRDLSWRQGYVPLQEPLLVEGTLSDAEKMALSAGWWRSSVALPSEVPPAGTITFPDGTLSAPLVSAADAYAALDQGDPPPCTEPTVPPVPAPDASGPDGSVSSRAMSDCTALTVTGVSLATAEVRTSRGLASAPAWRFDIGGGRAVLRVAVADPSPVPSPAPTPSNRPAPPEMVAAQDVTSVDGAILDYRLGVGACDEDITPIVVERVDVVVVSGGVHRSSGVCTDQLLIHPVSVTLEEPLGDRPVLDARNGTVLPQRALG